LMRSPQHLATIPSRSTLGARDDQRPLPRADPLQMNVFLWIVASQLALVFLATGAMKLLRAKENLAENGMRWTEDFPIPVVKSIGALEILAALGLILPALFDIAPFLVPLAALGLVLLMVGAGATHARRREGWMIVINSIAASLAAVVLWGRLGPVSFNQ
jgi:uncharacterized membrane protein YphA (DoxX/SURF4 family)